MEDWQLASVMAWINERDTDEDVESDPDSYHGLASDLYDAGWCADEIAEIADIYDLTVIEAQDIALKLRTFEWIDYERQRQKREERSRCEVACQ